MPGRCCSAIQNQVNMHFKPHIIQTVPYQGGSAREEGADHIVKLSSNENPIGPSPKAIAAIKASLHSLHEYTHQDDRKLRGALGRYYIMDPDQFIAANSGLELIDMICRAFLEPGSECIISTPTFLAYKNFAELQGATVIDVPLDPADFSLDAGKLLSAVSDKTRVIFLSSPNNPTGAIIPKKKMDAIMQEIPPNTLVVYDEVYRHFARDRNYVTAEEYVQQGKNIIGLNSFSKAYGLAGMRVAYAYSTTEIADYLNRLRRPFMINTLSTIAAIAALGDTTHMLATQKTIREEMHGLYDELDEMQIRYWPGNGNFILLMPPYDNQAFARDMLRGGVMVRTTDVFGLVGGIRLSVGSRKANQVCMEIMKKLVSKNSSK
jgi:histidinol-phosphate aminotransferase